MDLGDGRAAEPVLPLPLLIMAASSSRAAPIAALEGRLGHVFEDRILLERALTHASKLGLGKSGVMLNEGL